MCYTWFLQVDYNLICRDDASSFWSFKILLFQWCILTEKVCCTILMCMCVDVGVIIQSKICICGDYIFMVPPFMRERFDIVQFNYSCLMTSAIAAVYESFFICSYDFVSISSLSNFDIWFYICLLPILRSRASSE